MKAWTEPVDARREQIAALEAEMRRETATTPKELIHARGPLRLYRYLPQTEEQFRVPLLLVMSIVSKPYIFDLTAGQSFVEYLLQAGFDVYLVDWGTPRAEHHGIKVDDYVADLIPDCIAQVQAYTGERELTLLGYCLGGVFTALYAALNPEGPARNLLFLATPINAEGLELQRKLLLAQGLDADAMVDLLGNIPATMVEATFQLMRPLQKAGGLFGLQNNAGDPAAVKAHLRLTRWGEDALPLAGETFRQLAHDYVAGNKIVRGEFEVRGRKAKLGDITVPVLHVLAEHDHVVSAAASRDLVRLVGSADKEEIVIKGGHVSLVAGIGAVARTWPRLVNWLAPRSV